MKKEDLLFESEDFKIYKKHSGAIGTFVPMDCLELIDICIEELGQWRNAGLAHKRDYEDLIARVIFKLTSTIKKDE
jgi:hypothetical protein